MKPWRSFTPHDFDTTFKLLQTRLHERFLPTSLPIHKLIREAHSRQSKLFTTYSHAAMSHYCCAHLLHRQITHFIL